MSVLWRICKLCPKLDDPEVVSMEFFNTDELELMETEEARVLFPEAMVSHPGNSEYALNVPHRRWAFNYSGRMQRVNKGHRFLFGVDVKNSLWCVEHGPKVPWSLFKWSATKKYWDEVPVFVP